MVLPSRLARLLRSTHTWIGLGVLAPLGMLMVSGLMLLDLRQDAWDKAEQTSRNLLQVIERDIARNVEVIDLTLRAMQDNMRMPGLAKLDPDMRQLVLFDRATGARDLGVMFVLDENGDVVEDAAASPPRKGNYADRDYFQAHKANGHLGLYVGRPIVSRLTGERMVNFSRRIDKPDGSFGGLVLGSLKLTYFARLFDQIGLGQEGAINLYLRDGTRITRHPYLEADVGVNIAGSRTFDRFAREGAGKFVETSVRDGVRRLYTFSQVGDLPLILNVALAVDEVEAGWRAKAVSIGTVVLLLCGLTVVLSLLFGRELRHRAAMQAELARLSLTDALTGLPNRRRFEEAFEAAWDRARRTGKPLSLLVVDADHFKRYNDRYGHAVGDEVLKGLAQCLSAGVHRPDDLVARVGGEEFAILLPDTDQDGAMRIASKVHEAVATVSVPSAGIAAGAVTVSIGLTTGHGSASERAEALYRAADAALYEAKAAGRNQTRCAPGSEKGNLRAPVLRLVGAHRGQA
ncbi:MULTISPECIES: sensor domain-containing diguanylate cyclase [Methylobacteriaceae]|jgi:diguanylate cyclase (GGDEF)-like protein|uniref:diguanylate cyclase n=8 Tax=Pseudomonadota TaxID=1224 RepID=B1ZG32_METPB|nr:MULTISPECIES: sensor domain-containing diguanylate cyclase [Methylobacteriaceae]ACB78364.1 diguanylate cyclase [Methylorubrum populi BJ001]OAH28048.1 dethiobiotin synthetase [Methylorubrum populi]PIU04864.1 MAG: GGDEF domain-containing protein [Methylobacterium sp. CG09_land_8_20_14_0_10_71_15]PIU15357.1 MAG: GGDEF domain-containing protein [Methylobacterium sp. CG08_land_8_20_14_0_20_71_15]PZP67847.1 MAG: GGDEF domain-containing protein [Methylorubrum populi]